MKYLKKLNMKNLKLIALLLLLTGVAQAQTSDNPWLISAGINGIGLQSDFLRHLL